VEPLTAHSIPPSTTVEEVLASLKSELESLPCPTGEELRDLIEEKGYDICSFKPKTLPSSCRILTCDASNSVKELRYYCLWGVHSIALSAEYDGKLHPDPLLGGEPILYKNMGYDSKLKLGVLTPYKNIENRMQLKRMGLEYAHLLTSLKIMEREGMKPDFLLIDGSLVTSLNYLYSQQSSPEYEEVRSITRELISMSNVIALVEDSYESKLALELGFPSTTLQLMDHILKEKEFVSFEAEGGVRVCYLKLPSKPLSYLPSQKSPPLTVRWEFTNSDFLPILEQIAGLWLQECDLLHPQLYPVRIADYLTRKVSVNTLLEEAVNRYGLKRKYREMRES